MAHDDFQRHGFTLMYRDGWAVLNVPPSEEGGRRIYPDDVVARMRLLGIPDVPARTIRAIVEKQAGKDHLLVQWPSGASLGAKASVSLAPDAMTAVGLIEAARPGGAPADENLIRTALDRAGVTTGVDDRALHRLLKIPPGESVVLARGRAPIHGVAPRSECLFVTQRGKPWKELSGGRIDLKELHFIQDRKAGDLLTRTVDAVKPQDGVDVTGQTLPATAAGPDQLLSAGDGVEVCREGLRATRDGNVRIEDGAVLVEELVTVKNVDYSTGNIAFDGSVCIEGTVADGFTVQASGDIQIGKTLGRATVECGRNLVLQAGIVGDNEGTLKVQGDLFAKFLEGARATVAGCLFVTEAVLHSEVSVDRNLIASGGRGEITGGILAIGGSLSCRRIGNVYAGTTRIYLGVPPAKIEEYQNLAATLKSLREVIDELDRQDAYLQARPGTTAAERSQSAAGRQAVARSKSSRLKELKEGAEQLKIMQGELVAAPNTLAAVEDRIFSGAVLSFGLEEFPLGDKGLERVILRKGGVRVEVHGFKPGEDLGL